MSKSKLFRYLIGIICIIFSTVSKLHLGNIELSGSPNLAVVGVLFFSWPSLEEILNNFVTRGGTLELFGLKAEIKEDAEENYGIKIEELKTDLKELKEQLMDSNIISSSSSKKIVDDKSNWEYFNEIVKEYEDLQYVHLKDRKLKRIETDKKLIRGLGRLSIEKLEKLYEQKEDDKNTKMAIAVSLGYNVPGEEESKVNDLLITLLNDHQTSRIRFRAADSIRRRGSRVGISKEEVNRLYEAIKERKGKEKNLPTRNKCSEIEETLKEIQTSLV